ncbi:HNH endonuclease signature motif containing protein [Georgenia satyanarayanai]|uniref:HNH endonuclease signature motif containing protein n=1 Tax=Georgenia satyanarayanai TaxID=860221 RepID=UPI00186AFF37|nr:HNH endonuclease signature motif containing protein [Georgenia satyanarayanai]
MSSRPCRGRLGDYLEHLPAGPRLAQVLGVVESVEEVDEYSLVEVVAAYRRMESWAAARTAQAAAALSRRPALNPMWPGKVAGRDRGECVVGEELSMRLRMSRQSAMRIVETGRGFEGLFHLTAEALEQGQIDYPRAQAIVRALEGLPSDVAMAAQWEVLEKAPGRTLRQVQSDLSRAVIAVDPDHADERHRRARQRRCVYRPQALPDGMARVVATVPAADAVAFDLALDSAARAANDQGDKRTHDQLRADAFALMAHTALACGQIGPDAALRVCSCGVIAKSADGDSAFDAEDTALRSTEPDTACPPNPPPPERGLRRRPTTSTSSLPYPGHRLPGGLLPTVRLGSLGGRKVDVRITVPLGDVLPAPGEQSALERIVEPVAELEGYGPVAPVIARALAARGVWRRLVTDPGTEQVVDVGRTRYQPPAAMADLVRERDRTCTRPGCSCAARHAEIDHEHEWQHGGATSVENTGPYCGRDHRVKTIGAYTVAHGSDRTYAWAGPTGHGYLRRPDGTIVTMPRHTAEGLRALGRRSVREREAIDPAFVDGVLAEIAAGTDVGGSWVPAGGLRSTLLWPGVDDGPSWVADDEPPF